MTVNAPGFGFLGPLRVHDNAGRDLALGGPKPRAVLLRMLLEPGRLVSLDQLVESVWEERPPADAAKNVQIYIARMRKVLRRDAIVSGHQGYFVDAPPDDIDAFRYVRFVESARAAGAASKPGDALSSYVGAEALWRGDVLADVRYASFAQTPIAYYEQLRHSAREEEVAIRLDHGQGAELVALIERMVHDEPGRERRWGYLMTAYYQAGRQADALRAYERLRISFAEEMGLDPSPETADLEHRILRHDPDLMGTHRTAGTKLRSAEGAEVPRSDAPGPTSTSSAVVAVVGPFRDTTPRIEGFDSPTDALSAACQDPTLQAGSMAAVLLGSAAETGLDTRMRSLFAVAAPGEIVVSQNAYTVLMTEGHPADAFAPAGWADVADSSPTAVYVVRTLPRPSPRPVRRGNLAPRRNAFLGRDAELSAISEALENCGVLTLVGPGGIGKTRLAVEFAARHSHHYDDGVWFANLANTRNPTDVLRHLAEVLGLPDGVEVDVLIGRLSGRSTLIILDNCEHVAGILAELVEQITCDAPGVHMIATSRTRLGHSDERIVSVQPLHWDHDRGHPAVDLALARAHESGIELDHFDLVGQLCEAVSGIPLAIELAVAQLAHRNVSELLTDMGDQVDVLAVARGDRRHTSIRAIYDTSVALLSPHAQSTLTAASAFRGQFTRKDLAAVCDGHAADALRELVEASLCAVARRSSTQTRYHLLEPIRQFAFARLVATDQSQQVLVRHAEYFLDTYMLDSDGLDPADEDSRLANLNAAFDWCREQRRFGLAARIATVLLSHTQTIRADVTQPLRTESVHSELSTNAEIHLSPTTHEE